ncbi:MAG: hypothetical protein HUJ11_01550 [Arenibacter algicola]|nr:hypothetical protein [Arenibacter algicola]
MDFKSLLNFFGEKVSKTKAGDYQTIQYSYYREISVYSLVDHQDYFSLSKTYSHEILQDRELILNENFYLLQKIKS